MIEVIGETKNAIIRSQQRARRNRGAIRGHSERPRLSVFRSSKHIYLQLIDDKNQKTILSLDDRSLEAKDKLTKVQKAELVGNVFAKKALEVGIDKVVFDRGEFRYHGRIKAIADGARKGGLIF